MYREECIPAAAAAAASHFSRVRLCATPQTAAHQARPSLGFARQEYWSGVPLPSPDLVTSYIEMLRKPHSVDS